MPPAPLDSGLLPSWRAVPPLQSQPMQASGVRRPRWLAAGQTTCLVLFFLWLLWVPLPFGSVVEVSQVPLIVPPLLLAALAAFFFAIEVQLGVSEPYFPLAYRIWTFGSALLALVIAIQL